MQVIGACPVFLENLDHHLNMCMLSLPMRKEDTEGLAGQHVGKRPLEFSSRLKSFKNHGKMNRLPSKARLQYLVQSPGGPRMLPGWSPDGPPGPVLLCQAFVLRGHALLLPSRLLQLRSTLGASMAQQLCALLRLTDHRLLRQLSRHHFGPGLAHLDETKNHTAIHS